jgi:hypothetical protein
LISSEAKPKISSEHSKDFIVLCTISLEQPLGQHYYENINNMQKMRVFVFSFLSIQVKKAWTFVFYLPICVFWGLIIYPYLSLCNRQKVLKMLIFYDIIRSRIKSKKAGDIYV